MGFKFTKGPVILLGVTVYPEISVTCTVNYNLKLENIKRIIYAWEHRKLTLMGKVIVLKSHILSQLIYLLSILPNPSKIYIKEVEKLMFNFLWSGKNDMIKHDVLCSSKYSGGLNMMHLSTQIKALKIVWVKRLLSGNICRGWRQIIDEQSINLTSWIFNANLSTKDINQTKFKLDPFWQDVFVHWCDFNFNPNITCDETIIKQIIWYNLYIKLENKILSWKNLYSKKLFKIEDLLTYENQCVHFMTREQINIKYDVNLNFVDYLSLIHSIPKKWHDYIKTL